MIPSLKGAEKAISGQLGGGVAAAAVEKAGGGLGEKLLTGLKRTGIGAAVAVGGALTGALVKGWGRLTGIENAEAQMRGLGLSADKAAEMINGPVLAAVKGTAFSLDEAANAAGGAMGAGITGAGKLTAYLKLVGDAATQSGTDFNAMALIMNKVQGQGKLTGGVLSQMEENGLHATSMLAKHFHVSQAELAKMVSAGKVDAATFTKVLQESIGGAALKSGETTQGAFANMGAALSRFGARLLKDVFPLAKKVFGGITQFLDWATEAAGPFVDMLSKRMADALAVVGRFLGPVIEGVKQFFSGMSSGQGTMSGVLDTIQGIAASVSGVFLTAWNAISDIFVNTVLPVARDLWATLSENLGPALEAIGSAWQENLAPALEKFITVAKPVVAVLIEFVGWFWKVAIAILGKVLPPLISLIGWIAGRLIGAISTGVEWISTLVGWFVTAGTKVWEWLNAVKDAGGKAIDWFKALPGRIGDAVRGMWDGMLNAARSAFNTIASLWNNTVGSLSFTIPDIPGMPGGGTTISMPKIPMLAKGGYVTSPTLAIIGESGPEAVIPLDRAGFAQRTGAGMVVERGAITVNISGATTVTAPDVEAAVERGLIRAAHTARRARHLT